MTVHDRYEIDCGDGEGNGCGALEHVMKRAQAQHRASYLAAHHADCPGSVTIYDVMAKHGAPELWAADGTPIGWRE